MTRKTKPIKMPDLTIEAIIQIQDFLHLALDIFEDHYGQQLDLFYHSLWQESHEFETGKFSD